MRNIGNSAISKATIFAPFLSVLLAFLAHVEQQSQFHESRILGTISWPNLKLNDLYFLYYGLCSVGVASLVYAIFCPSIIKKYHDRTALIDRELDIFMTLAKAERNQAIAVLNSRYEQSDRHYIGMIVISSLLYGLGFVLMALPAVTRFVEVSIFLISGHLL